MRESLVECYLHLIWSTWDRQPVLTSDIEVPVYACIRAECGELKVEVLEIGGTENHVHLLVRIPATLSIATLAKQVKGASSHLVTHKYKRPYEFKWQGAYAAYSVSRSMLSSVKAYISNQKVHHATDIDPEF